MWMPNKNEGESGGEPLTETQPGLLVVFRHVYRFILQAVNCDKTTADSIFEDYLAGKKSCWQFRAVASPQIKQAHVSARSRRRLKRQINSTRPLE